MERSIIGGDFVEAYQLSNVTSWCCDTKLRSIDFSYLPRLGDYLAIRARAAIPNALMTQSVVLLEDAIVIAEDFPMKSLKHLLMFNGELLRHV